MWALVSGKEERDAYAESAADLMRRPVDFKAAMQQALELWPRSCAHNLTAQAVNHQAWLGHAGCCIALNSPEECTRLGWHLLNQREQDEANRVADEVHAIWRHTIYREDDKCLKLDLE